MIVMGREVLYNQWIKCACAGNGYSSDISDTPQHLKEKEAHQQTKEAHRKEKEAHHKEKDAHQQTQHLKHELEEELEKLKSSEFSVENTSSCCIITTWINTRNLGNLYWVGMFMNMYHRYLLRKRA